MKCHRLFHPSIQFTTQGEGGGGTQNMVGHSNSLTSNTWKEDDPFCSTECLHKEHSNQQGTREGGKNTNEFFDEYLFRMVLRDNFQVWEVRWDWAVVTSG